VESRARGTIQVRSWAGRFVKSALANRTWLLTVHLILDRMRSRRASRRGSTRRNGDPFASNLESTIRGGRGREKRAILFTDSRLENSRFLGADNSSSVAQLPRGYRGYRSAVPIIYKLPRIEPPSRKRGEGKRAPGTIFVNLRSAPGSRARFAARES